MSSAMPVGSVVASKAERVLAEFEKRLAEFGLEVQPDKTLRIESGRFAAANWNGAVMESRSS
jgi:hypothetical protein